MGGLIVVSLLPAQPAGAQTDDPARRDTVVEVLKVPQRGTMVEIARSRGAALRALPFDALPIAHEFLTDDSLSTDAAYAMLGVDEARALAMIFGSIPQSGPNIQRIAFTWFLDRYTDLGGNTRTEARTAALRTLDPVRSTANAEAALYILGLTGSAADLPRTGVPLGKFPNRQPRDAQRQPGSPASPGLAAAPRPHAR